MPVLVSPADGAAITGRTTFAWQWSGPALGENQGFEVRMWRDGQPDHYGAAEPTNENRIEIDPRAAYGVIQGGPGDYYWSVAVVQRDPYKRTGTEAAPRRVRVEGSGGGSGPSGGGPPGLPTSVPPPP